MTARQYYAKVPLISSSKDDYFWTGLDAKTLTAAQHICNMSGCMTEIAVQQGSGFKVISAKNAEGEWKVVYEGMPDGQEHLPKEKN